MSVFTRNSRIKLRRTMFNLSYDKKLTCKMGQCIPICCDEYVPGDFIRQGNEIVVRMQPMLVPILHEVNVKVDYFFVPYRLMWKDWEKFYSNQKNDFTGTLPKFIFDARNGTKGSASDYFGLPVLNGTGWQCNAWQHIAYQLIRSQYYIDENLADEEDVDLDVSKLLNSKNEYIGSDAIYYSPWEKDYFTSSLLDSQRGQQASLPITGNAHVIFNGSVPYKYDSGNPYIQAELTDDDDVFSPVTKSGNIRFSSSTELDVPPVSVGGNNFDGTFPIDSVNADFSFTKSDSSDETLRLQNQKMIVDYRVNQAMKDWLDNNQVDMSSVSAIDISELRLAFQVQKWLERSNRGGYRYHEALLAHFGVAPRDDTLQEVRYLGGTRSPIIVSEVLQNSATGSGQTPQGNLAGHGLTADSQFGFKWKVEEYGLIMGIMRIMPKLGYNSQGINRQWLRTNKYDYYSPEFANLSEQAVYKAELYANKSNTEHIFNGEMTKSDYFGYQGRYNEMRTKQNLVCGDMRDTLAFWHLNRVLDGSEVLNEDFITSKPSSRIFAVTDEDVDNLIVDVGNKILCLRPLPYFPTPSGV